MLCCLFFNLSVGIQHAQVYLLLQQHLCFTISSLNKLRSKKQMYVVHTMQCIGGLGSNSFGLHLATNYFRLLMHYQKHTVGLMPEFRSTSRLSCCLFVNCTQLRKLNIFLFLKSLNTKTWCPPTSGSVSVSVFGRNKTNKMRLIISYIIFNVISTHRVVQIGIN